jgi:hypothetical protein
LRVSGWVRGILITYGVAAFSVLFSRTIGFDASASAVAIGLAVQVALLIARFLVKRHQGERGTTTSSFSPAMYVLELVADAVTVFLFALGTYRAILAPLAAL